MLFSIYIVQIVYLSFELECEKNENKQKEAGIGPFLKKIVLFVSKDLKNEKQGGVGLIFKNIMYFTAASSGHASRLIMYKSSVRIRILD